jgi:hypothetical protein
MKFVLHPWQFFFIGLPDGAPSARRAVLAFGAVDLGIKGRILGRKRLHDQPGLGLGEAGRPQPHGWSGRFPEWSRLRAAILWRVIRLVDDHGSLMKCG